VVEDGGTDNAAEAGILFLINFDFSSVGSPDRNSGEDEL